MLSTYRALFSLLDQREKKRVALLLLLVIVSSLFEVIGVASILPFLQILSKPELIQSNDVLRFIYDMGGFSTERGFSIFAGFGVFLLIVFSLSMKTLTVYALTRFGTMRTFNISSRLLRLYLFQPYSWFLGRHTAALSTSVLGEVQNMVAGCLLPALQLLPALISTVMIVSFVFYIEPLIGGGTVILLGGGYGVVYVALRGLMRRLGQVRMDCNRARFRIVQEATGGIKELKLMGLEPSFITRFDTAAYKMAKAQSKTTVLRQTPRHALEALAFGGMILMLLYLILRGEGDMSEVVPTLGLVVVAFGRLFPALQMIFAQISNLRFNQAVLHHIYAELTELSMPDPAILAEARTKPALGLKERLVLENVAYSYPSGSRAALEKLDMTIPANTTVGIVGGTGAGKTTLVDIMLGLLSPHQGRLIVDGVEIMSNQLRAWQKSVGYVPQQIFLTEGSVAENIAFGLKPENIDRAAVERAARIAALHDFVLEELPQGYETHIGERGLRLSGGQRQRVGIARALYHDPDVLIMDEATSALDNLTERAVMEAVHNIAGQKTIVMIAHRLSTVRNCDEIFLMKHGRVEASGSYDELIDSSPDFRELAQAS